MAFIPIKGVNAVIQGNSLTFAFDTVKFSPKCRLAPITNATSIYEQFLAGGVGGKIQLSGPWDANNFGFWLAGSSFTLTLTWSTPLALVTTCTCIVEDIEAETKVDDIARCSVTCQITGPFTAGLLSA